MSNFKLGIFENLAGYFTTAYTECGNSVDKCEPNKAYSRYYLQKYYKPKPQSAKDNDVASQFTHAVVKFAQNLKNFDMSVGASPTLKKVLLDAAINYVDITEVSEGNTLADLVRNLNVELLEGATGFAAETTGFAAETLYINYHLLKNDKFLLSLDGAINNSNLNVKDKNNAIACLRGNSNSKRPSQPSQNCQKLNSDTEIGRSATYILDGLNLVEPKAAVAQAKSDVKNFLINKIEQFIKENYDVENFYVTGDKEKANLALKALKSGSVPQVELDLFNEFFVVMKKTNGVWEECAVSDFDEAKAVDFRINAKMDSSVNGKVPTLVQLIPLLTVGTNINYNNGEMSASVNSSMQLKLVFQEAYLGVVSSLLPNFNENANSNLTPDLEILVSDVLSRKTVPDVSVTYSETEKIARVLSAWQRVGEDVWKHTLPDGETVIIKPETEEFRQEVSREVANCGLVGFSKDPEGCAAFLKNVALDNTEELAKVAGKLNDDVAPEVVRNLHPKLALAILKSFGFHHKLCRDKIAGRQLEKMQRASEWLNNFVERKFDKQQAEKIKANQRLVNFLDLLAQLVNSHPSILNDNMITETEESVGLIEVPKDLADRKISLATCKQGRKPVMGWDEIKSNMSKIYGSFSRGLTFDGLQTNSPFGMDNLFPQMSMLTSAPVVRGSTWGSMVGGSQEKVYLQDHQTVLQYSRKIHTIIDELLDNLRKSGKELTEAEIVSISRKKQQFEQMEKELFDFAWNIQRYSQLLKVVETGNRKEIITEEHVRNYVNKYNNLIERYDKTSSSLNTLISLLQDCVDNNNNDEKCKTL